MIWKVFTPHPFSRVGSAHVESGKEFRGRKRERKKGRERGRGRDGASRQGGLEKGTRAAKRVRGKLDEDERGEERE